MIYDRRKIQMIYIFKKKFEIQEKGTRGVITTTKLNLIISLKIRKGDMMICL